MKLIKFIHDNGNDIPYIGFQFMKDEEAEEYLNLVKNYQNKIESEVKNKDLKEIKKDSVFSILNLFNQIKNNNVESKFEIFDLTQDEYFVLRKFFPEKQEPFPNLSFFLKFK